LFLNFSVSQVPLNVAAGIRNAPKPSDCFSVMTRCWNVQPCGVIVHVGLVVAVVGTPLPVTLSSAFWSPATSSDLSASF
jgi:hypothetical protein